MLFFKKKKGLSDKQIAKNVKANLKYYKEQFDRVTDYPDNFLDEDGNPSDKEYRECLSAIETSIWTLEKVLEENE